MNIRRKTNIEFVTDIMTFSAYGPMAQMLVMTAIEKYATLAAEERLADDGMLSPDAWQGCAKEILTKLKGHYA